MLPTRRVLEIGGAYDLSTTRNVYVGSKSVINSSKTETLLGSFSPSVEGLGVLLFPIHLHATNMVNTAPRHLRSSSCNIQSLITLINKPNVVKLMTSIEYEMTKTTPIFDHNNMTPVYNEIDFIKMINSKLDATVTIFQASQSPQLPPIIIFINASYCNISYLSTQMAQEMLGKQYQHNINDTFTILDLKGIKLPVIFLITTDNEQISDDKLMEKISKSTTTTVLLCVPEMINCYSLIVFISNCRNILSIRIEKSFSVTEPIILIINKNNKININISDANNFEKTLTMTVIKKKMLMRQTIAKEIIQRDLIEFDNNNNNNNNKNNNIVNMDKTVYNKKAATSFIFNININKNNFNIKQINNNKTCINYTYTSFIITITFKDNINMLSNNNNNRDTDHDHYFMQINKNLIGAFPNQFLKIQEINQSQCIRKLLNYNINNATIIMYYFNNRLNQIIYYIKHFKNNGYKSNTNILNIIQSYNDCNGDAKSYDCIPFVISKNMDELQKTKWFHNQLDCVHDNMNIIPLISLISNYNYDNNVCIKNNNYKCESFTILITKIATTTMSTTSITTKTQPDMNKSEYAFKKTLNNLKDISNMMNTNTKNIIPIILNHLNNKYRLNKDPDHLLKKQKIQKQIEDDNGLVSIDRTMNKNKANKYKTNNYCDIDQKNDFKQAKSDKTLFVSKQENANLLNDTLKDVKHKEVLSYNSKYTPFDLLIKYIASERELIQSMNIYNNLTNINTSEYFHKTNWGIRPKSLRLCGGGEQALNSGTTGWGSPPGGTSTSNIGSWGSNNPQQQQQQQQQQPQQPWGNQAPQANTSQQRPQVDPNTNNKMPPQQQQPTVGNNGLLATQAQQLPNSQSSANQQVGGIVNAPTQQQQQMGGNGNNWSSQQVSGGNQPKPHQNANMSQTSNANLIGGNSSNNVPGPNNGGNNTLGLNPVVVGAAAAPSVGGTSAGAAKNQLEQLNTMREALFSQDGWGCQHVNQDTNWDVPGTPEPGSAKVDPSAAPVWKPNINNGTELWEANLRNGGQPPQPPVQKTPWGHTPSTNLGGTWGEEDDTAEAGNVWTGGPQNNPTTQQWGQPGTGMWPATPAGNVAAGGGGGGVGAVSGVVGITGSAGNSGAKKDNDWGNNVPVSVGVAGANSVGAGNNSMSAGAGVGNNWGDPRELRPNQMDMRSVVDPRDIRAQGGGIGGNPDPRDMRMVDPREQMRGDMRGDPRGISGRLNGSSEMWGQHHNLSHIGQIPLNKMGGVGGPGSATSISCQWGGSSQSGGNGGSGGGGGVPPKDLSVLNKPSGWEEPSPPAQRRNMPNFDDGTSLWGQQQPPQQPPPQSLARGAGNNLPGNGHWKDMSDLNRMRNTVGGQNLSGVSGATTPLAHNRVGPNGPLKPDSQMWGGHGVGGSVGIGGRTTSWDENHSSNWDEKTSSMGAGAWGDVTAATSWANKNQQLSGSTGNQIWPETDLNDWNNGMPMPKQPPNKMNAAFDLIRNSKQYRIILEMGFKKEEVELALRATNFNLDEAMDMLSQTRPSSGMESWRRHEEHSNNSFDHQAYSRYPAGQQQTMPFQPSNNPNRLNSIGGGAGNSNLAAMSNIPPIQAQKYLQGSHNPGSGVQGVSAFNTGAGVGGGSGSVNPSQPSTQQLRMLVQQIQMAVQAGYLNHQILNQPLAPSTLILLNQLLTNIKQLQMTNASINRGGVSSLQVSVTITKLKQQIANLQNQIAAQQAVYVKQQAGHGGGNAGGIGNSTNDYLRGNQHDAINSLQGAATDSMTMNKLHEQQTGFQGATSQQSRLKQWKLPALDKDGMADNTDFSRAPGTTAKSTISTLNSAMGSLGLQGDGTWSAGRTANDGWPDSNPDAEIKDWPSTQSSAATAFTDLVPEFEPGKPWKGSQIKTIEDDPSITPGSVARSPLSISAAKDTDLFATSSDTSTADLPPLCLTSSTWSFNPTSQQNFTSSISKLGSKGNSWSDSVPQPTSTTSELWGAPMSKTTRGPPPGLGTNKSSGNGGGQNTISGSDGWIGSSLTGRVAGSASNWSNNNTSGWHSTWLLLKNLTAQIDGSTLRTLCMQHGPLQHFHLYLNHGIALCKYTTREEANKAQMALNNCVLGNTTICAESPSECEVQSILQHLGVPAAQSQAASISTASVSGGTSGQTSWRPPNQSATRSSAADTWGTGSVWPSTNSTSNLWTPLDGGNERGTPSSLNSFLPENLLGSELN